jgi:dTDP-4-amino-4,6-dideoxygalactose transaminase
VSPQVRQKPIRFNQPSLEGRELEYIRESVEKGHTSSSGPFGARVKELLSEETGASDVLMTTSCTAALELAGMMLDFTPGDTVVVPSFTFTSTALAFAREGARIIFCDIEPETLGIDPEHLASVMDRSVRAVVPVHYAGVAGDVEGLFEVLTSWQGVDVVEDNAHGLFGRWRGRPLGSLGRFAALSFHETKNFVCGEGGALLLNDQHDVDKAYVLYDKGTNRRDFFLGHVDKYSWKDTGSSFGLADSLAAYLWAQLEQAPHCVGSILRAAQAARSRAWVPSARGPRRPRSGVSHVLFAAAGQRHSQSRIELHARCGGAADLPLRPSPQL